MLTQISKHLCIGSLSNVLSQSSKANAVSGTCQSLLSVGKEKLQARRLQSCKSTPTPLTQSGSRAELSLQAGIEGLSHLN